MIKNPIIIVEDDNDDCELLTTALIEIGVKNEFLCFQNPRDALNYLKATKNDTFLIISDVNMPMMNGLEFKKKINEDTRLHKKCIPFVFLSTSASVYLVNEAYSLSIQGYFQKPNDIKRMNDVARSIVDYWTNSKQPTLYD
jgi:two-component SAPR family response regulator